MNEMNRYTAEALSHLSPAFGHDRTTARRSLPAGADIETVGDKPHTP